MTRIPGIGGDLILAAGDYSRSRTKWLEARRSGLGASDTSALLGLNPWATPYGVWAAKVDDSPVRDDEVSEAAGWGHVLEDPVARQVSKRFPKLGKIAPTPGLLRHEQHPWMLATLDRLLVPRKDPDGLPMCPLEIKTVGEFMYREHWIDGVPPVHIQIQVQQQLAVTEFDHAYVAVLVGGQHLPEPYRVERDDKAIERIIDYAGAWWERYVVGRTPPPLTFADRIAINKIHPGDLSLSPIIADDESLEAFGYYVDARRRRDEAIDDMDKAKFIVQRFMGEHTALADDMGTVLATWKPTKTGRSFRVKE